MREPSRKRQVETMKKRYGPDAYSRIGRMKEQPLYLAKWASWHRWKPQAFDKNNKLLPEYESDFYGRKGK